MGRWVRCSVVLVFALFGLACSSEPEPKGGGLGSVAGKGGTGAGGMTLIIGAAGKAGASGGGAGSGGAGGSSGAGSGGAGSGGASGAGSGGSAGSAAGAGSGCSTTQVLCNGVCVGPGETAGGCKVLGSSLASVLAIDAEYVYTSDRENLLRIPKSGGTPEPLAPLELGVQIQAVAVNDTHVFWSEATSDGSSVRRLAKAGGAVEDLDTWDGDSISTMIAGPSRVYYVKQVFGVASDVVSMGDPSETPVVHGTTEWPYDALTVDETHVYWGDTHGLDGGFLKRSPLAGGTEETIAGSETVYVPVYHDGFVYYYDSLAEYVRRVSTDGVTPAENATRLNDMRGFNDFLSGNDALLIYPGEDGVHAIGYDGSNPRTLVQLDKTVNAAEADATSVYLTVSFLLIAVPL